MSTAVIPNDSPARRTRVRARVLGVRVALSRRSWLRAVLAPVAAVTVLTAFAGSAGAATLSWSIKQLTRRRSAGQDVAQRPDPDRVRDRSNRGTRHMGFFGKLHELNAWYRGRLGRLGGSAICVVVAGGLSAPNAFGADVLYWSNWYSGSHTISHVDLGGLNGGVLQTSAPVSEPNGAAIDAAAGRIYWANDHTDTISYWNFDGSGGGTLYTGSATVALPTGLAIDSALGRIYWANNEKAGPISYANLDGSGGGNLNTGFATVSSPSGVAVDSAHGRIYWGNDVAGGSVSYANLDGSGGGDLPDTSLPYRAPSGVAIDAAAGRVYWTAHRNAIGTDAISYASLDGSGTSHDLFIGGAALNGPVGLTIDAAAGRVYWANYENAGTISYANLNGSGGGDEAAAGNWPTFPVLLEAPVGTGVPAITGGSITGSTLECSHGSWAADQGEAFLYRAPQTFSYQWSRDGADIAGATASSIAAGSAGDYRCRVTAANHAGATTQTSAPRLVTLAAPAGDRVYWGNLGSNEISFVNVDGLGAGDLATDGATVSGPQGVAIDLPSGRIYWANPPANKISYANLDGGDGGDLTTSGATVNDPAGVAIDPISRRIYWANLAGDRISFAKLDGSGGGDLNTNGATVSSPIGVAVDAASGRVYWANAIGKISYARLDNTGGSDLNTSAATVAFPVGVAIDAAARRIYWANFGAPKISYAKLDGSGGGDLPTGGATVSEAQGVAIDPSAGRIYWADVSPSRISFANLDGSGGGDLPTLTASAVFSAFPALLDAPRATGAPTVAGATATGSTLTCSQGSWAPDLPEAFLSRAPRTFTYQWSVDGTDIPGATHSSIVGGVPGGYSCRVTASNPAGSTAQTSAPLNVGTSNSPEPPLADGSIAPVLSRVTQSHRAWRAAGKLATLARKSRLPIGTVFSFDLNEPARVTFAFSQTLAGRSAVGRCLAQTSRNRREPACKLTIARGTIAFQCGPGPNQLRFFGRLAHRTRLAPGHYTLSIVATDSASQRSPASLLRFTILK
jgi:DNA-binding beta-propeller fold protein YncE